jgi:hypothetical protein
VANWYKHEGMRITLWQTSQALVKFLAKFLTSLALLANYYRFSKKMLFWVFKLTDLEAK